MAFLTFVAPQIAVGTLTELSSLAFPAEICSRAERNAESMWQEFVRQQIGEAGENADRYYAALKKYKDIVGANVTENLYQRHVVPLFLS